MNGRKRFAAAVLAAVVLIQPALPAVAQAQAQHNPVNEFALGFGSFIISPVYGGFKVAFAILGLVVGGFAWAFSGGDTQTADSVWEPTLRGTYVLSPEYLRGERPIQFIGPRG